MAEQTWSPEVLSDLASADELVLVISRADRADLRVPVWLLVVHDQLYVRSYKGVTSGWYRGVVARQQQAIVIGGRDTRVLFETVPRTDDVQKDLDSAYLTKYARFDYRDAMVEPAAVDATLRILPQR
jgi:hypothetical protein